ncbi:MAG: type III pantothenate kinase [Defluviitaleaceae bacterium]|nr:type III pantothenate kinase [Defluviitaleaceae bacterium]
MILAVNIGNTNIRAAVGNQTIVNQTVFYTTESDVITQIESGLGKDIWDSIEGSIIASVVPTRTNAIISLLEKRIGISARRINIKQCGDLKTNQYEGLLGEDRVVCCAHALQKFSPPFVLIDYGTATTINVVTKNGEFVGGAILPGLQTSLDALTNNTGQLPQISGLDRLENPIPLIGKNTMENLKSGAIIGQACATEEFISRIEKELDCKVSIIVTGGHGPVVLPYCRFKYTYEPSLLLEGLLMLYKNAVTIS